jgi:5-hydroxyisourate hydrolase-like protein (transthyretin family)
LAGASGSAAAAVRIEGQVQASGAPLANSTVTLWQASNGAAKQLAQTKAGSDGRFEVNSQESFPKAAKLDQAAKTRPL